MLRNYDCEHFALEIYTVMFQKLPPSTGSLSQDFSMPSSAYSPSKVPPGELQLIKVYKTKPTLGIAIEGGSNTRHTMPKIAKIQVEFLHMGHSKVLYLFVINLNRAIFCVCENAGLPTDHDNTVFEKFEFWASMVCTQEP